MTESEHEVVIAGAGPTGIVLAAELALADIDAVVVERRESRDLPDSRAGGLQSRTIEIFDQRGIANRFLAAGDVAQVQSFGGIPLDISDFPTRHPYGLALWQKHIERLLADWADELGVRVHRGREVAGFERDEAGVDVKLADGATLRAQYLVGCDGGRSLVRRAAGIEFLGSDATMSNLIAEADMAEDPEIGVRRDARGTHGIGRVEFELRDGEVIFADEGPVRLTLAEEDADLSREPTIDDVRQALIEVYGTDYGIHSPTWVSRFTDATRQAASYRDGRVLLAGDAAHVHFPVGGHGLSIGIQDAVNLGWKLAQVVRGVSSEGLLDTYETERHPATARLLRSTMAQSALMRSDKRIDALRESVAEMLAMDEPRTRFAAMLSGLDVHYDLGDGHPLVGRRVPDLELVTARGSLRVFSLLEAGRPLLLNLGEAGDLDGARWADRVQLVEAGYDGAWELPALGKVEAPTGILVRPDGHVAWTGDGTDRGLSEALTAWFGTAAY